jgi:vacuolar-type H+-ATPase subunit E/Vma4
MSLEHILQALEAEADRQIKGIERTAQAEIERVKAEAEAEAEVVCRKHRASGQAMLQIERTRRLNRAKLEASQQVLLTREKLIAAALAATRQYLATLTAAETYPPLLRQLTEESVATLGKTQSLCLHVRKTDVELMNRIAQGLGLSATVIGDLTGDSSEPNPCLGGLAVSTADNRISLTNTLEARLQRVAQLYRAQIAEIVFDQRQED